MRERSVRLPTDVQQTIRTLHPDLKRRVRLAVELLRVEPEAGKALRGELRGWYSLRVGRLRIIYRPLKSRIDVAAIGPRSLIYFETARRLRHSSKESE